MKAPVAYMSIGIALSLFAASEHKQGNCAHTTRRNACIENEDKAYGELQGRIAARIRLWPDLAPHETEANPGRYVYDERCKTWRRRDVSQPEVVVIRPTGTPRHRNKR